MQRRTRIAIVTAGVAAAVAATAGAAVATADDADAPVTGDAREKAVAGNGEKSDG